MLICWKDAVNNEFKIFLQKKTTIRNTGKYEIDPQACQAQQLFKYNTFNTT